MIIWPSRNTNLLDWADTLRLTRPDIEINPRINDEKDWKRWASHVTQSQICQTYHSPRPDIFPKWQNWADAFIKSFGPQA